MVMQEIDIMMFGQQLEADYVQVYLHGKGGFLNEEELFRYPDFPRLLKQGELELQYPFILLHALNGEQWDVHAVHIAIQKIRLTYPNSKIHLMGYSRGGTGVYRYVDQYNDVSLASIINSKLEDFSSSIPVQVIHACDDQTQPLDEVQAFVADKVSKGLNITLKLVPGDHFSIGSIARSGSVNDIIDQHRKDQKRSDACSLKALAQVKK
jgi:fermentation-respiration switch protein FrsA (DUF1100 family)